MGQFIAKYHRICILAALTLASIGVLFLSYENQYRGRFYPGVVLGGVDVGGKSYGDARALFEARAKVLADNGLQFIFRNDAMEKEVKVPIFTAGLTPDNLVAYFTLGNWAETIRSAYNFGRSGPVWRRVGNQARAFVAGKNFDMPGAANSDALRSLLGRELKRFFTAAAPAQFAWGQYAMVIVPERIGAEVPDGEILSAANRRLAAFDAASIRLAVTTETPEITAKKLEPFLKLANDIARSTRLAFHYENMRWNVSGKTLASWLTLKNADEVGIDTVKLKAFLTKTVVPVINDPPRNSRFAMRDGKLVETIPGKAGNVVDVETTVQRVEKIVYAVQKSYAANNDLFLALASAKAQVHVPVRGGIIEIPVETTVAEPQITGATIANYRIRDLVGSARTSFKGSSADRRHNIETGIAKLNGILLAPGEEFSAVKGIGTTTEEEGFVKEFVIKDSKSIKELGGGLCQVATTLFRLALNAGLPVTERTNHRYVVSYYGPGLDATIYGPTPDLRFLNDTDGYLLLQGRVEGDEALFELYGQYDGRVALVSAPVLTNELPAPDIAYLADPEAPVGSVTCSETPHKGITADVTYTVRYAYGEIKERQFHSEYQPWRRVCLVGLKM